MRNSCMWNDEKFVIAYKYYFDIERAQWTKCDHHKVSIQYNVCISKKKNGHSIKMEHLVKLLEHDMYIHIIGQLKVRDISGFNLITQCI